MKIYFILFFLFFFFQIFNVWSFYRRPRSRDRQRYSKPELDDEPQPFKIYEGRVNGIKDFGCFVSLDGVKGKKEGLVHISQLPSKGGRINHPSDVVKRGQEVKVKVTAIAGSRISLSIKDVDQETGEDLAPHMNQRDVFFFFLLFIYLFFISFIYLFIYLLFFLKSLNFKKKKIKK